MNDKLDFNALFGTETNDNNDEEAIGTLLAISVVAKRLAKELQKKIDLEKSFAAKEMPTDPPDLDFLN